MSGATTISQSEAETAAAGRDLARRLEAGSVVLLAGDLGAGKTVFVKGLAEGLGIDPDEVSSPTFTLVQEYRGGRLPLYHVDLYRLRSIEVDDLGLDEMAWSGGVVAIEWPDRLPHAMDKTVAVSIEHGDERRRTISIAGPGDSEVGSMDRSRF
jgi:tRNA threonylcarbamoyladenosine biosynthesis protein TsaE